MVDIRCWHDAAIGPRAAADAAHELVAAFLEADLQASDTAARELLDDLKAIAEGREARLEMTGNAHAVTATADGVIIEALWVEGDALPLSLGEFIDAVRTWHDFLLRIYGGEEE